MRNCYRCGVEFLTDPGRRICPACRKPPNAPRALSPVLSFRERQVVGLVVQARSNKEIAFGLSLTEGTIKEYMHRIFRKVGVCNRTALAMWASVSPNAVSNLQKTA